jgi:hypothetical protein
MRRIVNVVDDVWAASGCLQELCLRLPSVRSFSFFAHLYGAFIAACALRATHTLHLPLFLPSAYDLFFRLGMFYLPSLPAPAERRLLMLKGCVL